MINARCGLKFFILFFDNLEYLLAIGRIQQALFEVVIF
jgi:hypothetical protein